MRCQICDGTGVLLGAAPDRGNPACPTCRGTGSVPDVKRDPPPAPAEVWAVVELMGHVRRAGRLSEEEKFGVKLGRLDIPQPDGTFFTRYFGGPSIYSVSIVSEEAARAVVRLCTVAPVQPWELPKQIAGKPVQAHEVYDLTDERLDDEDDDNIL